MSTDKTNFANLDDLFKPRLEEQIVEVEGRGQFKIRSMSRLEISQLRAKGLPHEEIEQHMLAVALVEPKVTVAQARQWQEVSPAGELEGLINAIARLSKMDRNSAKEVVKNFREGS